MRNNWLFRKEGSCFASLAKELVVSQEDRLFRKFGEQTVDVQTFPHLPGSENPNFGIKPRTTVTAVVRQTLYVEATKSMQKE